VAGLNRPAATPEEAPADQEALDVPVIGEDSRPEPKIPDNGEPVMAKPSRADIRRRRQDPEPLLPAPVVAAEPDVAEAVVADEPDVDELDADELDADELDADEIDYKFVDEPLEPKQPNLLLPIGLVVLALLIAGLGWWFTTKNSQAQVGSGNNALADVNATKDVVGAAQQAVSGVLSYKFDEMDQAATRAKQYLAGAAVEQYDKSMQALSSQIQSQKLQVTVNPVSVGVVRLNGDDARVLVFADQIGVRTDKQPAGGPTQFAMDMHRTDGKWKIVKLDFFDGK
jgi:Mce-associated membrane protein